VPSYKKITVLFVEKRSLLPRFLAATGWKEGLLLMSEAVMFGVSFVEWSQDRSKQLKKNLPSWPAWPMKMKVVRSFETSGSTWPTTERHIPEGVSSQQRAVSTSAFKTALRSSDSISLIGVYQHPGNGLSLSCLRAVRFLCMCNAC